MLLAKPCTTQSAFQQHLPNNDTDPMSYHKTCVNQNPLNMHGQLPLKPPRMHQALPDNEKAQETKQRGPGNAPCQATGTRQCSHKRKEYQVGNCLVPGRGDPAMRRGRTAEKKKRGFGGSLPGGTANKEQNEANFPVQKL